MFYKSILLVCILDQPKKKIIHRHKTISKKKKPKKNTDADPSYVIPKPG